MSPKNIRIVSMKKVIFYLFAVLLFFVPIVLWPYTSEVFEFNKMVLTYTLTALIIAAWGVRSISERKFIFRRTILDIPLLVFISSQFVSTLLSIDPLTSWLGYYSRYNGGFVSILCYSLLYWAFVSNFQKNEVLALIKIWLGSTVLVSLYGVLEHFGIDKNIWVQDVQSRVFSTLGQPNWLAAWLVALIPTTWAFLLKEKVKTINFWVYFSASLLLFWTLIFTKSRSGFLGFGVTFIVFWAGYFWLKQEEYKKHLNPFVIIGSSLLFICLISGTQFTPSIFSFVNHASSQPVAQPQGPALETGGSESGAIRKIVWKGAVEVWKHYPVLGTGVETFAFAYPKYRPVEHNLVSEWDFIYNKAHNEYLNFAANTGTFGIVSYLVLIGFSAYLLFKSQKIALLAGYVSLLVTNFFGFSVVPTQLELFLFPAFAITLAISDQPLASSKRGALSLSQKVAASAILIATCCLLIAIFRYWHADTLYSLGKNYNDVGKPNIALTHLNKVVESQPKQALFHNELAEIYTSLALTAHEQKNDDSAKKYADLAIAESQKAISISPANINLKKTRFGIFIKLSLINPNFMVLARDTAFDLTSASPTDAKMYYNLGLAYAQLGQIDDAFTTLKKTIELKANYKDARLAYTFLLIKNRDNTKAREELEYILKYIDPNDSLTKQTLESLK